MDDSVACRVAAGLASVGARTQYFDEHFGRAASHWKHDGTRVTPADLAISKAVFDELSRSFPEDQFFSEETEPKADPVTLTSRFVWVLDPIDGTNNYATGIPFCAISLALLEDGIPVCGFVYDFGLHALFHGGPGIGLFRDDAPIERESHAQGSHRILGLHTPVDDAHLPMVSRLIRDYKLRAFGSGTLHLTYVALGKIDACLDLTIRVWDIAAAWAFCQVTGVDVHFLGGPVFPMKTFDVHMAPTSYLAACHEDFETLKARL